MNAQRVYLVTGASSGIGHATAFELIRHGHMVYGAARRVELMADLVAAGGRALRMDVTDEASVRLGVRTVLMERGRIDGLLANAGYAQLGMLENVRIADAQHQFDVNVMGAARVVQAVLPQMRTQRRGTIVFTSSVAGKIAVPGMAWYSASKHALEAFADALRLEVRRFGIQVAIVEPTFTPTGLLEASMPTLDRAERADHAASYVEEQAHFRRRLTHSFDVGTPVDRVTAVLVEALESGHVGRRYWPSWPARVEVLIKEKLGDAIVDRVLRRMWLGAHRDDGPAAVRHTPDHAPVDELRAGSAVPPPRAEHP